MYPGGYLRDEHEVGASDTHTRVSQVVTHLSAYTLHTQLLYDRVSTHIDQLMHRTPARLPTPAATGPPAPQHTYTPLACAAFVRCSAAHLNRSVATRASSSAQAYISPHHDAPPWCCPLLDSSHTHRSHIAVQKPTHIEPTRSDHLPQAQTTSTNTAANNTNACMLVRTDAPASAHATSFTPQASRHKLHTTRFHTTRVMP